MAYQRKINVKCNLYKNATFEFIIDFIKQSNNQTVVIPINVCDNSDNSEICIKCVNNLWHFIMDNPDYVIRGSFDPLTH